MATLSPYHTYSPSPYHSSSSSSSSPSSHAEALLSRARQLSSNAYERSRASAPPPLCFAEGEDFNSPSTPTPTSPFLEPTASRASASLHQLHRNSFNEYIRDHSKRRSSHRLSSVSSTSSSTKASSPLSSEFPSDSSPSTAIGSSTLVLESTTAIALMPISQQTSQGTIIEPSSPGDHHSILDKGYNADATSTGCPTKQTPMTTYSHANSQTQENSSNISFAIAPPPATYTTASFQHSSSVRRKHLSDIGRGDRYIVDILGALRDSEQSSSGSVSQSEFTTSTLPMIYGRTTDALQDQSRTTQQKRVTSICVSTLTPTFASVSLQQNQTNTFTPFVTPSSCTPSKQEAPTIPISTHPLDPPAPDPAQHPTLDQTADMQRVGRSDSISSRSDSISSMEKSDSPTSDDMSILSRESSSHSLNSSLLSAPPPKKERRSSRLLGKFMPKFLHSSHGHSSSSSTSSSQPTGTESHQGNPTETKSGSTTDDIYNKSVLPPLPDTSSSPLLVLPDSAIGMDDDWLVMKSDMGTINSGTSIKAATPTTPTLLDATPTTITTESPATPAQVASSYSSYSSHNSFHSFKIEDYSEQSTEPFKEAQGHRSSDLLKVKDEVEEVRAYVIEDEQSNEADYSSYSPYTIEEDDDDFFRNSVLRKKTRPHSMMPSISIESSFSSSRRTPSLSTSFTSSSQASSTVPSPTTSLPPSTLSPTPVSYGIDEKRSRLSDAVKEWRRSASASLGSTYSMTYSGFSN